MNEWRLNYINGKPFPNTDYFDGVQNYRIAAECNGYVLGVTEKGNCAVWSGGYHANGELREVSGGTYFTGGFGEDPEKLFDNAFAIFAYRASRGKVASVEQTRLDALKEFKEDIDDEKLDLSTYENKAENWIDLLDSDVRERLATCSSTRDDILPLTKAFWNCNLKNSGKDYSVGDALVSVLRLVDENGRYFDLTGDERDDILYEVGGIQREEKELDLTEENRGRS